MIKHILTKVIKASDDPTDTVTIDIPLLIRLLELAREDIKSDVELHDVVENVLALSKENDVLTMEHYEDIANIGKDDGQSM
jgi:hypothetical protein